jgi:putative FmdB family regulatory protein
MTYEYACGACGHEWEAEQPISAKPLKKCPKCGKQQAKRLVSGGTGFLLKGGGWYADGYGSAKSTSKASDDSSGSSSTPKKDSEKKTESKASEDKSAA